MTNRWTSGKQLGLILAMITLLFYVTPVQAQCADSLVGKWTDFGGQGREPASFDIYFTGCGDTSGESTSYGVRVWTRSDGVWHARQPVKGDYRPDQDGRTWFRADVYTGGYQEQLYIRKPQGSKVRVFIRWKSLDSKPDATEWRTFSRDRGGH